MSPLGGHMFAFFLLTMLLLQCYLLKNPLKSTISKLPYQEIRLDNAGEFSFQTFIDFYMSIGIDIQHPNVHVHNQNGLACLTITFKNITTSLYLG